MPFYMEWMRNRYSLIMRSGRASLDGRFEGAITFDLAVGSRSNFLLEFPDALFNGVDEGSIFGDDEVWSSQAGWTVRKGHNFRSDRWIAIKLLLEFPDAFLRGVDEESIFGDDEVWSS